MKLIPISTRLHPSDKEGFQKIYRFENSYGASVVKHTNSYGNNDGLLEMCVVKFNGEDPYDFDLDHTTPVSHDVLGWLTEDEVEKYLHDIKNL